MRVLHVGKYYPPFAGGIEVFTKDLCAALARRGVRSRVIVHAAPGDTPGEEETGEVAVIRVPVRAELLYTPLSPGFRRALARELASFDPDLLHLHVPNPSALWLLTLAAARKKPWVLHWHSDILATRLQVGLRAAYPFFRPLERRLLRASAAIIATSRDYLDSSRALAGWRHKTRVIPLGLDPRRLSFEGPHAATEWPGGGLRVLALGRFTYYKGFGQLIDAVAAAPDTSLILAGRGQLEASLRERVARLGLRDRVRILTGVDDADRDALLASCDVLCQPSLERTEAFGLVLLEAMAFAKPVLVSDIPGSGAPWVVRTAEHGLAVPPGDVAALAAALRRLAREPDLRRRLGDGARHALDRLFHIDRTAGQVQALYEELLSTATPRAR